jgi:DNA mismatch repair ATPase MutS
MAGSSFIYILAALFIIWLFAFITYFVNKKKQKKLLLKIREGWAQPGNTAQNFDLIANFSLLTTTIPFHRLPPQTIKDIDIHELFAFIDRTNSKPGQQYLFNKLITPTNNITELEKFNEQVNFFTKNKTERENIQLLLSPLNNYDAYYITALLHDAVVKKPKWSILFVADTVVVIVMLLLSIIFPVLLLWLMVPLAVNIFYYFRYKNITARFNKSFPQLNKLINISKLLLKKDLPFENAGAGQSINNLKKFQRKFGILSFGEKGEDEITQTLLFFVEIIKAFFLVEIHSFFSILTQLKNKREDINNLINYIGSIDAALSTASLRAGNSKYTTPVFITPKKELTAKNLYHPLIENCITNSITIKDKSILVTGSNMSGKSTFIRAVAVNAILAQTIYTCFADEFTTPVLKVFSSIRITDNLLDAKSYYFEEVNTIGSLIKESEKSFQNLFILDEVFKGTNTIERVAGAKAILSYLNKSNNIVLVSTHDIELAGLLKNEFDLYHFVEDIANDNLVFDHQLKSGTLQSRNAIKILALSNYPAEIIQEATSIANKN